MRVLGIETSCDETGVAIFDEYQGLIANTLFSQIDIHKQYGGVVPELASRDHVKYLIPLVDEALTQANLLKSDIDAIAYTAGPGLIGALLTGASFAKSLALGLGIPALAVHHLEAHILAAKMANEDLTFPFLSLLVSGGHTQLIMAHELGRYEIIGDTLDDAVGEAFDKTAKLMGIPYPGGAKLAGLADRYLQHSKAPAPNFPRPMTDRPGLDFSFSGLKTFALNAWTKSHQTDEDKSLIAAGFQEAVVDTLIIKCKRALSQTHSKKLVVAGGVGANMRLRGELNKLASQLDIAVFFPPLAYCTDNGAMVAYAGIQHLIKGARDEDTSISVKPRWPLAQFI